MNGTSGFQEVRSSTSRSPSYRFLQEHRHRFGTGAWHLLRCHNLIALPAWISAKKEMVPDTLSPMLLKHTHQLEILTGFLFLLIITVLQPQPSIAQMIASATVEGIEITQSIQSMGPCTPPSTSPIAFPCLPHGVPLIAGKPTVVRVYLTLTMTTPSQYVIDPIPLRIKGQLQGTKGMDTLDTASLPPHLNLINPATQLKHATLLLDDKRKDVSFSLNFLLPNPWTDEGVVLTLSSLTLTEDLTGSAINCTNCLFTPSTIRSFPFQPSPTLRVQLIGVQYQRPSNGAIELPPTTIDKKLIQSWLHRAYPVATNRLMFPLSYDVVKGFNSDAKYFAATCNDTLTFANEERGIATNGIVNAHDDRLYTHFFGLMYDGGPSSSKFQIGCSPYIGPPVTNYQFAFFTTVGSSPTGPIGQPGPPWFEKNGGGMPWDMDGSYGDWYTGHELGHNLGRLHVAKSKGVSDCATQTDYLDTDYVAYGYPPYSFPQGQLSDLMSTQPYFVGFDVGDPSLGTDSSGNPIAPMKALPGEDWHDMMTYCVREWVSSDSYTAILSRLNEEGVQEVAQRLQPPQPAKDSTPPPPPTNLRVTQKIPSQLLLTAYNAHHEVESAHSQETLSRTVADQSPSVLSQQPAAKIVTGDLTVVLATVNLTKKTATINSVIRVESATTPALPQDQLVRLQLTDAQGKVLFDQGVTVIPSPSDSFGDRVGTIRAVLPYSSGQATLDVLLSDKIIHTLHASQNAPQPGKIFAPTLKPNGELKEKLVFRWEKAMDQDHDVLSYNVQVRSQDTESWRTIALDLPSTELPLDLERFKSFTSIQIKVIVNDGYHSSYVDSTWFTVPHVGSP